MVVNVLLWEYVIIAISNHKESYPTEISKEIGRETNKNPVTHPHMLSIIKDFEALKWVTTFKRGRLKIIKITPKGSEIAHNCRLIVNSLQTR